MPDDDEVPFEREDGLGHVADRHDLAVSVHGPVRAGTEWADHRRLRRDLHTVFVVQQRPAERSPGSGARGSGASALPGRAEGAPG